MISYVINLISQAHDKGDMQSAYSFIASSLSDKLNEPYSEKDVIPWRHANSSPSTEVNAALFGLLIQCKLNQAGFDSSASTYIASLVTK